MPAMKIRTAPGLSVLAFLAALAVLAGCWAGEDERASLLDRHSPAYTEPKGTRHAGDYMPLAAGDAALLSGSMKVTIRLSASGTSQGMPVSRDTTMVAEATLSVDVRTLAARAVQLARGTVEAIPQEATTRTFGGELLGSVETKTLTSYFQKVQDAVHLIAVSGPDGFLVEPPKPLYLKIPLVVGESWDSHAADIPDLSEDGVALDMQAKSRTFVVGRERVGAGESAREAVRLEQATELSGSARSEEGVSMGLSGRLQTAMHFAEGVGQVRQKMIGRITLSGSVAQGGDRINMTMTMDFDGEMGAEAVMLKRGCAGCEGVPMTAEPAVASASMPAGEGGVDAAARALAGAALRGILSVAP